MSKDTDQPILVTRGLEKSFGALKVADSIDFGLRRGARHALIGPNGAGKTSFVNLLTGVTTASSGVILFDGRDITAYSPEARVRSGLGRTFQITSLFKGMTTIENVALAVASRSGIGHRVFAARSREASVFDESFNLLMDFGLQDVASKPVSEIAYGQQRLVEIAIALGLKPKVLILDEPAAGIPSSETHLILDALTRLPNEISILIIEHDMSLVARFADTITVLVQGATLMSGPPDLVLHDSRVREVYLGTRH